MNLTKSYETFMLLLVGMKSTRTTLQNNEKDCKLNEAFFLCTMTCIAQTFLLLRISKKSGM